MKYKYFLIFLLALFSCSGDMVFSDTISPLNPGFISEGIEWLPVEIFIWNDTILNWYVDNLLKKDTALKNMQSVLYDSISEVDNKNNSLERVIKKIESVQLDLESDIWQNNEEIKSLEDAINKIHQRILYNRQKTEENKKFVKNILVQKYQLDIQNISEPSIYASLFSKGLWPIVTKKDTLESIQENAQVFLNKQIRNEMLYRDLLEKKSDSLLVKQKILEEVVEKNTNLSEMKELKKSVLSSTISTKTVKNKIAIIDKKRSAIQSSIEQKFAEYESSLMAKYSDSPCDTEKNSICKWIKKYVEIEKKMNQYEPLKIFKFPVDVSSGFWYHFRDQSYYHQFNSHHTWVDILIQPWLPVKSVWKWYLVMKQYPKNNFPGMVMVKHSGWMLSIYTGIVPSELTLFTEIDESQIIWTTREHMEHSWKNNLHLELYHYWKPVDIIEYIDLSEVSESFIPNRYGWKYIDDLRKKNQWFDVNWLLSRKKFFHIEWDTESEKQINFLRKYASSDFSDRSIWVDESLSEKIDPTFVICVGFAESTLWKQLTTPGNIWNVGNNDSGDRVNYSSTRSGIRAIWSVLNNQYLGQYITIDDLSGWWNKRWPIYASSQTNWHENIVKCMSAIKWKYVWNNASFRLTRALKILYEKEWFTADYIDLNSI